MRVSCSSEPQQSRRALLAATVALTSVPSHPAFALPKDLTISDIQWATLDACPPRTFLPAGGKGYSCLRVSGKVEVPKKGFEAADVFGFVKDVDNNSALAVNPEGTSRTVVSSITNPVKGGGVREVEFVLTVSNESLQRQPLKFIGFKVSPQISVVEERFAPFSACEVDPESEGCAPI
eukprot:CAMPEP_0170134504 /NCGR_PEP_ID=MMETSP0033_2-20121228/1939_1 /TAXON_ID=195969 /ORGANISM="Dolichomastix tenuilepis, Strain CCMP3274" /LENGTH=177 /DNA_ID=CAMNT_0010370059 /DNA_START=59 /DNA_END=592 /DNA_ORIENTATION=+